MSGLANSHTRGGSASTSQNRNGSVNRSFAEWAIPHRQEDLIMNRHIPSYVLSMIRLVMSRFEDVEHYVAIGHLQGAVHKYEEAAEWSRLIVKAPALLDEIRSGEIGPLSQEFGEALRIGRQMVGRMDDARKRLAEIGINPPENSHHRTSFGRGGCPGCP